ncbi:hypothetical protein [Demequina sediminis]|uniref:hypothetical protein n=1 Tax=Demequina sediminis TaxID=1930058 RepID=UPI0031ED600C
MSIGELFDPEPQQWGLRGDPMLWRELKSVLAGQPLPPDLEALATIIEEAASELVGAPLLGQPDDRKVERFVQESGMSTGWVSADWWNGDGMRLLRERFASRTGAAGTGP